MSVKLHSHSEEMQKLPVLSSESCSVLRFDLGSPTSVGLLVVRFHNVSNESVDMSETTNIKILM